MLILNSELISLREQQKDLQNKLNELKELFEKTAQRRAEIEKKYDETLEQKEQILARQVSQLYQGQPYRFSARLSEDKEYIELFNQSGNKVGIFTKDSKGHFKPIGTIMSPVDKQEDLTLARTKIQLYQIFENTFK